MTPDDDDVPPRPSYRPGSLFDPLHAASIDVSRALAAYRAELLRRAPDDLARIGAARQLDTAREHLASAGYAVGFNPRGLP